MTRIELVTLIAAAATAAAACEVNGRNGDARAERDGRVDSQMRADVSGVRAEIALQPASNETQSRAN